MLAEDTRALACVQPPAGGLAGFTLLAAARRVSGLVVRIMPSLLCEELVGCRVENA
jgi:hypothetical protein